MSDSGSAPKPTRRDRRGGKLAIPDLFDLEGSDAETLNTGRIPDPQAEHTPLFRWMARVLNAIEARLRARGALAVRWVIRSLWTIIALVGIVLLIGPVINKPLDIDDVLDSADISEVDWVARDVELEYSVEREDDGTFATHVTEKLTAHFLNDETAREIRRQVVTEFQGRDVEFAIGAVSIDGTEANVTVDRSAAMTTIRIAPADGSELSGQHEVTLEYELHNLADHTEDLSTGRMIDEWSWPLFASWPQATAGLEASFWLSHEVNDVLIRKPSAYIGWLLLSESVRLDVEETTSDGVLYSFSNDQNLPPNADFWVQFSFTSGTFTQTPTTALFWVQTWGPLLPLALLGVVLLFALAARRVVWADSAGNPWYSARSEPPEGVSPEMAARVLRAPEHAELIHALRAKPSRTALVGSKFAERYEGWLRHVAEAASRAGRIGNFPAVITQRTRWNSESVKTNPVIVNGLRWVPDSYLRDTFILAPIAITLVQWGLLRQLSHQVILTVVWWPGLIVLVSTLLAAAIIWAVWKPRPLTRAGALIVQQLKGVAVYARTTQLLGRGPVDDALLPYALLSENARTAGEQVRDLAVAESGDRRLGENWKTRGFISMPALGAFVVSLAILAGSIVWVSTEPPPYSMDRVQITRHTDLRGTFYTQVRGFDISAEVSRGESGQAELRVTERHDVEFAGNTNQVPQFVREWPASRFGQDLDIRDIEMSIDGEPAPFRVGEHEDAASVYAITQNEAVLDGIYDVEVTYTLGNAVVEAERDNRMVQQLRWVALYWFWEDTVYTEFGDFFGDKVPVRPIKLEFTVAPDLVDEIRRGGWIDSDYKLPRERLESGNSFRPWSIEEHTYLGADNRTRYELRIGEERAGPDGSLVATLDIDAVESRLSDHEWDEENTEPWEVSPRINRQLDGYDISGSIDLGVYLEFESGTFTGVTEGTYQSYRQIVALPFTVLLLLAGLVIAASIAMIVIAARNKRRPTSASLALVSYAAIPMGLIAQCVLFFWVVGPMPGDDSRIAGAMVLGTLMFVGVIAQAIFVTRMGPKNPIPASRAATRRKTER